MEIGKTKGLREALRLKWIGNEGDTLKIYARSSFINRGYPADFVEKIDSEVGSSKGWPNIPAFSNNLLSDQD